MPSDVRIVPASEENFDELMELIEAYQKFYKAQDIDRARNRNFFSRFLTEPEEGVQFIARMKQDAVGFVTLYFPYSSTRAGQYALMNDLFVSPEARAMGVGAALITKASEVAAARGFQDLCWMTARDNVVAQRLYDRFEVQKSAWYEYSMAAKMKE